MKLRAGLAVFVASLSQAAAAQVLFPTPDAEGCFEIAQDFTFCGAPLGWSGNGSSHPAFAAIFNGETRGDWLVFKLFDPETGTMGAFKFTPSTDTADIHGQNWLHNSLEIEITAAQQVGGGVTRDVTSTVNGRDIRSVMLSFQDTEQPEAIRIISEFTDEPWSLLVSSSSTGPEDRAWQKHLDALAALRIDK